MNTMEFTFRLVGEASTIEEIRVSDPQGFDENQVAAKKGEATAGKLRCVYEEETGGDVISEQSPLKDRRLSPPPDGDKDV